MNIICTPSHGLLALVVDIERGAIVKEIAIPSEMTFDDRVRPFGIAKDSQGNWYIANNTAIAYLTPDLTYISQIAGLPRDLHQLYYDGARQKLWAVATSIDALLAIDPQTHAVERFCLRTDQWVPLDEPAMDTLHANSILISGETMYVMARKFGQTSSVYSYNPDMERVSEWEIGKESHSLCEFNGELYLLDSRGGRILGSDMTRIQICDQKFYARGMAITPEGVAVVAVFTFGGRETRQNGDALIYVYDIKSGKKLQEITLPDVGNIQDIQFM